MPRPLFAGLIIDESGRPVDTVYVGADPMYVVDDAGFRRHILTEQVDRQVLDRLKEQIEGHEDIIGEQTAKMLGQDDLFSRAVILNQIRQMDQQFNTLLETGLPQEVVAYLGMMGFQIVINMHGEVVEVVQPGQDGGGEEDE